MKIKIKIILSSILLLIFSVMLSNRVFGAPPFPTTEQVQQMIAAAIDPIQDILDNLTGRTETLEQQIVDLEERVAALENLSTPSPSPSPSTSYIISDGTWKFSDSEEAGWLNSGFDDSSWIFVEVPSMGQCGPNPVGGGITENGVQNISVSDPNWAGATGYFRKTFNLSALPTSASIRALYDDDGDVYLNGNLIISNHDGFIAGIDQETIDPSTFNIGTNVLAVAVDDAAGGCQWLQAELTLQL